MKNKLYLLVLLILQSQISFAQGDNKSISTIPIDKSTLSGIGLRKIDLKDEPEKAFYQKNLFRGSDLSVYVVSTENWTNTIADYSFDEFVYMLHGQAIINPSMGNSQVFNSGDYFFAPKNFAGNWTIDGGNYLHYELSVITTRRADSTKISINKTHGLFHQADLSGLDIKLNKEGFYKKALRVGVELTVSLQAESPQSRTYNNPLNDYLIQVLSGKITLVNENNKEESYFTGEFFIIPSGFSGHWNSEGHGLVKFLTIERTKYK